MPARSVRSDYCDAAVSEAPQAGTAPSSPDDDLVVVVGTRPEAIKLAGITRLLGARARVIHTGQHYDAQMWHDVVNDLAGVSVAASIAIGGRSRGEQIGCAVTELTRYLAAHPARAVVVQGDTNSTLGGAIAASTLGVPVVHVEAGLRSHDRAMPEEINRILVDAVADLCCAPIHTNAAQLRSEGVAPDRILITGNTLADALAMLTLTEAEQHTILQRHGLEDGRYVLSTIHRAGTVDDPDLLAIALEAVSGLAHEVAVVLPLHPHTAHAVERWHLDHLLDRIQVIPPLPPKEFMALEAHAALLVSDSGGVQEEACLFRRPLVVLRDSTERPELLDGWCRLVGDEDPQVVLARAWQDLPQWRVELTDKPFPYGTEASSSRIIAAIDERWPAPGRR